MTGEECPGGRAVFQRALVVGPISAGRRASVVARPEPLGPRNWGQSEARVWEARGSAARSVSPTSPAIVRMVLLLLLSRRLTSPSALHGLPSARLRVCYTWVV